MRSLLTIGVWSASTLSLLVGGLIAIEFVLLPTSLDIGEMVAGGSEPWIDALEAAFGFCGLLAASVAGLWLWHTVRFRMVGLALVLAEVAAVAVVGARVYSDYF